MVVSKNSSIRNRTAVVAVLAVLGAVANQFHIPEAIEPYSADIVSAPRRIVLGKKSGLVSIKLKIEELGLDVPEAAYGDILAKVKDQATAAGRLMTDDEFRQLVQTSNAA